MLKIAICDDNLIYLEEARTMVAHWAQTKGVNIDIVTFENGDALLEHHKLYPVDVIILDIVMPFFSGMETAGEVRKNDSVVKIIFLTTAPEYAVDSYDVKANGYLLKPIDETKLHRVLNDCLNLLEEEQESIVVRTLEGYQKIYINKIEYVEAQNRKSIFILNGGSRIEGLDTFTYFVQRLVESGMFFRCHRSYLISLLNVDNFNTSEIVTKSGYRIPVARGYGKDFKQAYFSYMFKNDGERC